MEYRNDHPAVLPAQPAVNGHIVAKEVKGMTGVSVPDYELPSLEEIEAYINRTGLTWVI